MVSSRDRSHSQRHLIDLKPIAKTPPPAFLFPFNDVKEPVLASQSRSEEP
jgi:hypothetical protein